MTGWIVAVYVVTLLCLVDALRRPASAWAEADKVKSFWVTMMVVSLVVVLPALVIVPAYAVGVLPRFSASSQSAAPDPFRK